MSEQNLMDFQAADYLDVSLHKFRQIVLEYGLEGDNYEGLVLYPIQTLKAIKEAISSSEEENTDEGEICVQCNGSGEGHYEGTRCWHCNGKGVELPKYEDDPWD